MALPRIERLPGGDARTTPSGAVWLVPRGARPPANDPVGDRLDEIASQAREDFSWRWFTKAQVRELTWRSVFTPGRFQSMFRMYAGRAIQDEVEIRAHHDPITRGVRFIGDSVRPGPDFKGAPGVYYELTTVQQLSDHLGRDGMRPANGSVRFLLYPGF